MEIKFKQTMAGVKLPKYATEEASCFDLYSAEDVVIRPSECATVRTGIIFEPEEGYGIMMYPRSGVSKKTTLRFANSVGVIDNDYRGEVMVLLENAMPKPMVTNLVPSYKLVDGTVVDMDYSYGYLPEGTIVIKKGDRIAQAMPIKIEKAELTRTSSLSETKRGKGGFGSTGVK
jgi:dUTP pyrophosphatase